MKSKKVIITQEEDKEIPAEIIANSIVEIAKGMRVLNKTRLTRRAIVALIHEHSKVPRTTIELVINNIESLEEIWLKKS